MKNNNKKQLSKILKVSSLGLLVSSAPIGLVRTLNMSNINENMDSLNKDIKLDNSNQKSVTNDNFTLSSNNTINIKKSDGSNYNF